MKKLIIWLAKTFDVDITKEVVKYTDRVVYVKEGDNTVDGDLYVRGNLVVDGSITATGEITCRTIKSN